MNDTTFQGTGMVIKVPVIVGKPKKQTNYDVLMQMGPENMAEKIKCPYPWDICIHLNEDYPCSKCKLDWLKQEDGK